LSKCAVWHSVLCTCTSSEKVSIDIRILARHLFSLRRFVFSLHIALTNVCLVFYFNLHSRDEPSLPQIAEQKGRPRWIPEPPIPQNAKEETFFSRAKTHLNLRELSPDKPAGSRRHTPYAEFLKCLHLYGAGILNREELVLLLKSLFEQGHAPKTGANAGGGKWNTKIAKAAAELLAEFESVSHVLCSCSLADIFQFTVPHTHLTVH
jgi:hypothetical protein